MRAQFATLGQYNFVNIVETETEEAVYKLSMKLNSRGDLDTIVLPEIPLKNYINDIKNEF
jgi:uncharacterized protein with GYD domain